MEDGSGASNYHVGSSLNKVQNYLITLSFLELFPHEQTTWDSMGEWVASLFRLRYGVGSFNDYL